MAYEPFALKYRPRVFADVVGQEAVAATLRNSVRSGRVANAFLFAGSRGTGKTSMARILAKALNCPQVKDGEPCGACETCVAISRGDDLDVIEIDGASNRGIDEIRAIRDNVGYAPAKGRFKIYIIDEVHMLTIQAFNALLKTLEEPPPHVKFVFATTEAQVVPETILSRCQRYEFRRIAPEDIVGRLQSICAAEKVEAPSDLLREIAVRSEGGMRDSLGTLDQLVAFSGATLAMDDLDRALGLLDAQVLAALIGPMGKGEAGAVLDALDAAFETGRDAEDILTQVMEVFREAMVREARGIAGGGDGRRAALVALVRSSFSFDRLLLALRLLLNARREMKLVGQGRLQLELAFLKIARSEALVDVKDLLAKIEDAGLDLGGGGGAAPVRRLAPAAATPAGGFGVGGAPARPAPRAAAAAPAPAAAAAAPSRRAPPADEDDTLREEQPAVAVEAPGEPAPAKAPARRVPAKESREAAPAAAATASAAAGESLPLDVVRAQWPAFLKLLREQKPRTASTLDGSAPERLERDELTVRLGHGKDEFQKRQLDGAQRKTVEDLLERHFGRALRAAFLVQAVPPGGVAAAPARKAQDDPAVRKVLESFNGGIVAIESPKKDGETP